MEVSFANSKALSTGHYRLVQSLETAKSPAEALSALLSTLSGIQQRWSKGPVSSSSLHRDLLLALYCASQQPGSLAAADQELLGLSWCLENAVKLAGGDAKLEYRKTGYRVCDEIFTEAPHALKLLLINTIRSDISAPAYAPQAPARWIMGLRAAASPRLAIPELVPAVGEKLLEVLSDRTLPPHLPRLALAALLNLLRIPCSTTESLLPRTQEAVVALLSPSPAQPLQSSFASSSASSTGSSRSFRGHPSRKREGPSSLASVSDPALLAALVGAITSSSPLVPLPTSSANLISTLLALLQRTTTEEWATKDGRWDYQGIRCGWLVEKVLRALEERLRESDGRGEAMEEVIRGVLDYVKDSNLLERGGLAQGLLLSCISLISVIPTTHISSLPSPHSDALSAILSTLASHLQRRSEPNIVVLGSKGLSLLGPSLWTGKTEADGEPWGEKTWKAIMVGLESAEAEIRKETIRLLLRVDGSLVDLHLTRLLASLKSLNSPSLAAFSATSPSRSSSHTSTTASAVPSARQRAAARDHLLALLLEASAIVDAEDGAAWAARVREIISIASPSSPGRPETLLPLLIASTIDRFTLTAPSVQADFGRVMLDAGGWRGSVNEGLVVAASAGMGDLGQRAEGERIGLVEAVAEWLAGQEDTAPPPSLLEPFLLCLLRLLALLLQSPSFHLSSIPGSVKRNLDQSCHLHCTSDTQQLFSLVLRALSSTEGADVRSALRSVGQQNSSDTLVAFWEALQAALADPTAQDDEPERPQTPPRISQPPDRPLRYSAYSESPSSSLPTRASDVKGKGRAFDETARERIARGGRGGIGESLLGAGALALLGVEEGLQVESDEDEDKLDRDHYREEEEDEEKTTPMQRSVDEQSRSRERSSSENSARGSSPPADLLIELEAVNPFHDGS